MKYKKAKFPIDEAGKLWIKGWCWGAVGKKYGYHGDTIKKWVTKSFSIDEYKKAHESHQDRHFPYCPKCFSNSKSAKKKKNKIKAREIQESMFNLKDKDVKE